LKKLMFSVTPAVSPPVFLVLRPPTGKIRGIIKVFAFLAGLIVATGSPALVYGRDSPADKAFPAKIPLEKPSGSKLSAAMERMYDVWNPHEDRANEFFSNFKYSRLEGFSREPNVSRRDPSKVIRVDGTYYVYYTCRRTEGPPAGPKKATDTIPSRDWDLAEVWYATSKDGFRSSYSRVSIISTTRLTA
jgi:hypothetical protein